MAQRCCNAARGSSDYCQEQFNAYADDLEKKQLSLDFKIARISPKISQDHAPFCTHVNIEAVYADAAKITFDFTSKTMIYASMLRS